MKEIGELKYQDRNPEKGLSDYVKCFWELENSSLADIPVTILPDGYFDILFLSVDGKPFQQKLIGLATNQATFIVPAKSRTYSISFKLAAAEYVLKTKINLLVDCSKALPYDFWEIRDTDFCNIETFINSVTTVMTNRLALKTDARKLALFRRLYETDGAIVVGEVANMLGWKSRQINRYFNSNFGLSLKKYCNILRFRASFEYLRKGQFSAAQGYFDQPHFIRDVHKFSGTSPKHLADNKKDCFIQLATLPDQ